MTTTFGFGRGTAPRQWYLEGTDPTRLPSPPADGIPPLASSIEAALTDPVAGSLVLGGRIAFVAAVVGGQAGMLVDPQGGPGAAPNAAIRGTTPAALRLAGFDHVDVALAGAAGAPGSIVEVIGAQRANIVTGDGADTIRIDTARRDGTLLEDDYRILAGGGNDTVRIGGADIDALAAAGDASFQGPGGAAVARDTSGARQRVHADLGAGNDVFLGRNATADQVQGGAGSDTLWGGAGNDTLAGGAGRDVFAFLPGDGRDVIADFVDDPSPPPPIAYREDFDPPGAPLFAGLTPVAGPGGDLALRVEGANSVTLAMRDGAVFDIASLTIEVTPDTDPGTLGVYQVQVQVTGAGAIGPASVTVIEGNTSILGGILGATSVTLAFPTANPGTVFFLDDIEGLRMPPPPAEDLLRFPAMAPEEVEAMLAAAVQDGADTLLDTGDGLIRLMGVDRATLGLDDVVPG